MVGWTWVERLNLWLDSRYILKAKTRFADQLDGGSERKKRVNNYSKFLPWQKPTRCGWDNWIEKKLCRGWVLGDPAFGRGMLGTWRLLPPKWRNGVGSRVFESGVQGRSGGHVHTFENYQCTHSISNLLWPPMDLREDVELNWWCFRLKPKEVRNIHP